jgi:hypothetical protein
VPLDKGDKPPYRAGYFRELEAPEALSRWGASVSFWIHQQYARVLLAATRYHYQ